MHAVQQSSGKPSHSIWQENIAQAKKKGALWCRAPGSLSQEESVLIRLRTIILRVS
jgi:hypothetical protein